MSVIETTLRADGQGGGRMTVTWDGSEDAAIVFFGTDELLVLTEEESRLAAALIDRLHRARAGARSDTGSATGRRSRGKAFPAVAFVAGLVTLLTALALVALPH